MTDPRSPGQANPYGKDKPNAHAGMKLTARQTRGLMLAGLVLLGALGAGCSSVTPGANTPGTNESAANPGQTQEVPALAQFFINDYKDRFKDPLSTWYAKEAYKKAHDGMNPVLSDGAIKMYLESKANRQENAGPLGFNVYRLPDNAALDENKSIEIFNDYTSKELSLYLNYLAKNPTPEGEALVDSEFMNYCSDTIYAGNSAYDFTDDDRFIATIMDTMKSIVSKYGSTANYTVLPSVLQPHAQRGLGEAISETDKNKTSFEASSFIATKFDKGKHVVQSQSNVDIVIAVDVYRGSAFSTQYETIERAELTLIRQPIEHINLSQKDFTYISIGQLKAQ